MPKLSVLSGDKGSETDVRRERRPRLFRRRTGLLKDIDFDALRQFAATIESELDLLEADAGRSPAAGASSVARVRAKLDEVSRERSLEMNWSTVYHAEKLMLALFSDERTDIELRRRMNALSDLAEPFVTFYRGALSERTGESGTDEREASSRSRDLLLSLVGDVHAYNCRRFIKMRYARVAIYKVGASFVVAFTVFLSVLTVGHWA